MYLGCQSSKNRHLIFFFYRKNGRASAIPHFTFTDFIDYLYSIENDILDPSINQVNLETADAPLSHYFINSSHNSYLTGRFM